jgi:hypothetical protein
MTDVNPRWLDVTAPSAAAKTALYLRVSTGGQAESNLSIPDQRRQITVLPQRRGQSVHVPRRPSAVERKAKVTDQRTDIDFAQCMREPGLRQQLKAERWGLTPSGPMLR